MTETPEARDSRILSDGPRRAADFKAEPRRTRSTEAEWECGGCGATAPPYTKGWSFTDAAWCPKCEWLA